MLSFLPFNLVIIYFWSILIIDVVLCFQIPSYFFFFLIKITDSSHGLKIEGIFCKPSWDRKGTTSLLLYDHWKDPYSCLEISKTIPTQHPYRFQ